MPEVIVRKGEPIDRALKRLKSKLDAEGLSGVEWLPLPVPRALVTLTGTLDEIGVGREQIGGCTRERIDCAGNPARIGHVLPEIGRARADRRIARVVG